MWNLRGEQYLSSRMLVTRATPHSGKTPDTACRVAHRSNAAQALHELAVDKDGLSEEEEVIEDGHSFCAVTMMRMFGVSGRFWTEILTRRKREGSYKSFLHAHRVALNGFLDRTVRASVKFLVSNNGFALETA